MQHHRETTAERGLSRPDGQPENVTGLNPGLPPRAASVTINARNSAYPTAPAVAPAPATRLRLPDPTLIRAAT